MNSPANFTTYARLTDAASAAGLLVMGAQHPARTAASQLTGGTLVLLGAGAVFWPVFSASDEARDGLPDPIDRWSTRLVNDLALIFAATPLFPFGGPPYAPFIDWALKSGRAFQSPTGMMVHDTVGMMISYRGALHFADEFDIPAPDSTPPCDTCTEQPCRAACPVGALSGDAPYDLAACHGYLDRPAGAACLSHGCAVRRACPVSKGAGRIAAQSAHHMKAFHPK